MISAVEKEMLEDMDAYSYAVELASYAVLPMCLSVAIELRLFEIIAKASDGAQLTAEEVVAHLGASNPRAANVLDRVLRLLASHDVFTCSMETADDGRSVYRYGVSPTGKFFTPNDLGVSISPLALRSQDKVSMKTWYSIKEAVLHGGVPVNLAYDGKSEFELHEIDPRYGNLFNEAMRNHSVIVMKNILDIYHGFDDVNVLVDVGGGTGGTLGMILTRYPHLKGINFDLPHVIAQATPRPGVEFVGGDMFSSIPSGDAIFMKWILHDWQDEECVKILENCRRALPPEKGKVIVIECFLPETPEVTDAAHAVFHVDMIMLAHCQYGRERTEAEFRALANRAGFSGFRAVCSSFSHVWVMEFTV